MQTPNDHQSIVYEALLEEDFRSHVGHRSRHTGEHPAFRIMDGDVKIGEMGVALLIQQNIVGSDVPFRSNHIRGGVSGDWTKMECGVVCAPVNDTSVVQVREGGGQLCSVKPNRFLREVT